MSKISKSMTNSRIEKMSAYELIARMFGADGAPLWVRDVDRDGLIGMAKAMRNKDMNERFNRVG